MNRPSAPEIRASIKQFIVEEIAFDELELDDDTPLFERGLLNSLNIVQLIAHLEGRYGFTLDPGTIKFENFVDIERIAQLIESSLAAAR